MKDKIKTIIEDEYDSDINSREIIQLFNKLYLSEAKRKLAEGNVLGAKAIASLIID